MLLQQAVAKDKREIENLKNNEKTLKNIQQINLDDIS